MTPVFAGFCGEIQGKRFLCNLFLELCMCHLEICSRTCSEEVVNPFFCAVSCFMTPVFAGFCGEIWGAGHYFAICSLTCLCTTCLEICSSTCFDEQEGFSCATAPLSCFPCHPKKQCWTRMLGGIIARRVVQQHCHMGGRGSVACAGIHLKQHIEWWNVTQTYGVECLAMVWNLW